ncbi:peptidase M36 [Nocardioides sp. MAH-18]|uniref:Peptidase M36 n=1 Tax=Nocardioides agri TaxID=2682843 RepID=A0A6L6XKI9_9ACTN|nr:MULTISPECIES: M36 family metallopeptidase [unclassified Nocardioides]MBA2956558.1 M36 family metallopeptidase [Nocardioides sp. CGMCC 1.13656]MVQ47704.1 peptidase M36 [Nocardioides sp. MAH-18]
MSIRTRRAAALFALVVLLVPGLAQLPALAAPGAPAPGPAPAPSRTPGDPVAGLRDLDVRAAVAPTALQREAVDGLGPVRLRWNAAGTPASILPLDGSLGAAPGDPVTAARAWVAAHADVLGLGAAQVTGLEVVNDQRFADSDAHAVLLRQRFGTLAPATGGLVTIGIADGQVAYVSSSLSRATGAPAASTVSPLQGWLAAAANVGLAVPAGRVADIVSAVSGGWTRLTVPGFPQEQTVRLRALPMADGSVRPVLEANVVQVLGGNATAYRVLVDGATKDVLVRHNAVDNAMFTNVFQGTVTSDQCGARHAFELDDDLTKTITATAIAVPTDDVTVTLEGPGGLHETQDLLTSPELATFSSTTGFPAGTYSVQVCPFDDVSITVGQYAVLVATSDSGAPETGGVTTDPRWRYFTANPDLGSTAVGSVPGNSVVGCWTDTTPDCTTPNGPLATNAANDGPWDALHGVPTATTVGNNANTHEAWADPLAPGGLFQAPLSPTRDYTTEFTDAWNESGCDPTRLVPTGNDIDATVTNLFVAHNRMHDHSYYLGFTEDNYNLQLDNRGHGGVPGDQEIGNAQAGALTGSPTYLGRDNANQITLNDGIPGITNQYLFQPIAGSFYSPCADGALDMSIVGHEYTHAISNRMVGGPDDGLTSEQGGAMGESWGDLNAAELMFANGYSNGASPWVVGPYATGNSVAGIRDYAIDQNPLNYSDYGFDTTGPEVHADGEIWNGTQWEVRQALVEKWDAQFPYDDAALQKECAVAHGAQSPLSASHCPGNRRWLQLMFDAFLLQQGSTSMLDARDAMIAADRMRFGGENAEALWAAYARRGMGRDASTPDSDSSEPTPSFATPTGPNATVTFASSGAGRVYVGDYEARVTPVADTDPATGLGASAEFTPGTYRMLYVSPDRGFRRFELTVTDGSARTVTIDDTRPNVASAAAGATVIGATEGSLNAEALIDGTEATNWGGVTAENVDTSKPYVAVDLAGDVQTIDHVQVSALLTPTTVPDSGLPLAQDDPDSGSRFTALRKFELRACTSDCSSAGATWTTFFTSEDDAFPGTRPRPVAPDQTLRGFEVPPTRAAAVRLVALENQCTGNDEYAGEQDEDPNNATDCATASDRGTIVHAAELQVFAADAPAGGSTTGGTATPSSSATGGTVTPGAKASPGAKAPARTVTRVQLPDRLRRGTPGIASVRVTAAGVPVRRAGSLVVVRDGHRSTHALGAGRFTLRLPRSLAPGLHRVRVRFVPADPTAYVGSVSPVVVFRVTRSR